MSKHVPDHVYIWGLGWFDRTGNMFSDVPDTLRKVAGIILAVLLVAIGVGVVESVFPWLPWL